MSASFLTWVPFYLPFSLLTQAIRLCAWLCQCAAHGCHHIRGVNDFMCEYRDSICIDVVRTGIVLPWEDDLGAFFSHAG